MNGTTLCGQSFPEKAFEDLSNPPVLVEFVDKIAGNTRSKFADAHNCLDYETEIKKYLHNIE